MRLACAYLEGKNVDTVTAQALHSSVDGALEGGTVMPADASLQVDSSRLSRCHDFK